MPKKAAEPYFERWQFVIAFLAVIATAATASAFWYGNIVVEGAADQTPSIPEVINQSGGSGNSVIIGDGNRVDRQ